MERIALKSFGNWYGNAWRAFTENFAEWLPFGGMAFAVTIIGSGAIWVISCLSAIIPGGPAFAMLITFPLGILIQSVTACGLAGAAFAGLHGRIPTFADFTQDIGTHAQAALCLLLSQGIALVAAALAAAPGLAMLIPGIINGNDLLTIFGAILMVVLVLPATIVAMTLCYFSIPLVVDKKLDFWSATLTSVDCARRDLPGLMLYVLSWAFLSGLSAGCTCGIGTIFFGPWLFMTQARAYNDYFGLQEDRFGLTPVLVPDEPYGAPHEYDANAGYGGGRGYTPAGFEENQQAFENYARDYYGTEPRSLPVIPVAEVTQDAPGASPPPPPVVPPRLPPMEPLTPPPPPPSGDDARP